MMGFAIFWYFSGAVISCFTPLHRFSSHSLQIHIIIDYLSACRYRQVGLNYYALSFLYIYILVISLSFEFLSRCRALRRRHDRISSRYHAECKAFHWYYIPPYAVEMAQSRPRLDAMEGILVKGRCLHYCRDVWKGFQVFSRDDSFSRLTLAVSFWFRFLRNTFADINSSDELLSSSIYEELFILIFRHFHFLSIAHFIRGAFSRI